MKVCELIHLLSKEDPQALVVVSKDAEGNGFERLGEVVGGYNYDAEDREIGISELTNDDILQGYTEEDVMEDGEKCVILWP